MSWDACLKDLKRGQTAIIAWVKKTRLGLPYKNASIHYDVGFYDSYGRQHLRCYTRAEDTIWVAWKPIYDLPETMRESFLRSFDIEAVCHCEKCREQQEPECKRNIELPNEFRIMLTDMNGNEICTLVPEQKHE